MLRVSVVASKLVIDLLVLAMAFTLAFVIRFDGWPPTTMFARLALVGPYVVLGQYLILALFGVRRFSWRYVGLREIGTIFAATTTSLCALIAIRIALGEFQSSVPYLRHGVIPFGVLGTNAMLAFLGITGARVARRLLGERVDRSRVRNTARERVPTLLVGAGQFGVMMARELVDRPEMGLEAVGFVDDDEAKTGTTVSGVRVLGRVADLERHALAAGARQVLLTISSPPGAVVRDVVARAERAGLAVKVVPGLWELAGGTVNFSRIRDVAIEDLLGRDPVKLDNDVIRDSITGRTVLVTGAGGSIGSEICRQVIRFRPAKLVLVERAEPSLFQIHRELLRSAGEVLLLPLMADVTDEARLDDIFSSHKPDLVLHAAAHKHVPLMEANPGEALKNNVGGTALVAGLAAAYGTSRFVMISTDKAVNPSSVMGATKRLAEMFVQSLGAESKTRFVTVRFGNVLGSAGSVIPIFREQIKDGGPVTITHPEMRRYFMTIPEACQLVLQAGAMGEGGEIFVLDMGQPVKIVDLARDLISLSGLRPGEDIEIQFTGMRPGEKLFEEIATDEERAEKTRHPKIFIGKTRSPAHASVRGWLTEMRDVVATGDSELCVSFLHRVVPEYHTPARSDDAEPAESTSTGPAELMQPQLLVPGE